MKNIHLIPTDKPSRLYEFGGEYHLQIKSQENFRSQHICITNDEEIKEGDWLLIIDDFETYVHKHKGDNLPTTYYKKIILTTDQDLIKDGIQAIDDEFLEWFVKNPSCEKVETDLIPVNYFGSETIVNSYGFYKFIYKIIIPKEEPKQYPIGGYAPGYYSCTCVTCKKEFTGDKRAVQCEPCAIQMTREEPKQKKDLAYWKANAEEDYIKVPISVLRYITELEKRMYSEEEVLDIINSFEKLCYTYQSNKDWFPAKKSEWFEQFKKK
jgi:hypothetical protein